MNFDASPPYAAIAAHDPRFVALLGAAGLPVADLTGGDKRYWGLDDAAGRLVAAGGLEVHGPDGILRSCVVAEDGRGRGTGGALVDFIVGEARGAGVGTLYLLTETAEDWFLRHGFTPVARADVPPAVAASSQFAGICPASAAALKREL